MDKCLLNIRKHGVLINSHYPEWKDANSPLPCDDLQGSDELADVLLIFSDAAKISRHIIHINNKKMLETLNNDVLLSRKRPLSINTTKCLTLNTRKVNGDIKYYKRISYNYI